MISRLEYQTLIDEYESLKRENEDLNEQYIAAELENFELTLEYEQLLDEDKSETVFRQCEQTAPSFSHIQEKK